MTFNSEDLATKKQLHLIKSMCECLGLEIPDIKTKLKAHLWIREHIAVYKEKKAQQETKENKE